MAFVTSTPRIDSIFDVVDPDLLQEIEDLYLLAQHVATGAIAGTHASPQRGTSIEFNEHKRYTPGDDIRQIDWRAFAKTDRYHVKQFEDETNLQMELVLDQSGSMGFAFDNRSSKLTYAKTIAAAMSFLALKQGDAIGLVTYATQVENILPARTTGSHLIEIFKKLITLNPAGTTNLSASLHELSHRRKKDTHIIVLSDLFETPEHLIRALQQLRAQRQNIVVFHLLDPAELEFPFEHPARFESMEGQKHLFIYPRVLKNTYCEQMRKFLDTVAYTLTEMGIDYFLVPTSQTPTRTLINFLRRHKSRKR